LRCRVGFPLAVNEVHNDAQESDASGRELHVPDGFLERIVMCLVERDEFLMHGQRQALKCDTCNWVYGLANQPSGNAQLNQAQAL
jgi:hypothetical protein